MRMKIKMTMTITSIVIEVIRTVFFIFYERYFKCKKQTKASK